MVRAKGLPHAIHVADRWHLFENASAAFLDAVPQVHAFDQDGDRSNDNQPGAEHALYYSSRKSYASDLKQTIQDACGQKY